MSVKDRHVTSGEQRIPAQAAGSPVETTGRRVQTTGRPTTTAPAVGWFAPAPTATDKALAVLRVLMGLTFLWAFLDKTFGLGYSTSSAHSWLNGGSPTKGFLSHVQVGPFQGMLRAWAGTGWADWLFMLALLGIGLALTLGIGMRIATSSGVLLLAMMWISEWPLAQHTSTGAATQSTNPLIDYHLVYIVVLIALALTAAGTKWGLGQRWHTTNLVRRNTFLR